MRKDRKITINRIREIVSYEAETGVFRWLSASNGRWPHRAGDVAGSLKDGYRRIFIDGSWFLASSLAWAMAKGEWPARNLRFKDSNRDNAAIGNLEFGENDNAAASRRWRNANPEKRRAAQRKTNYGISQEQYEAMLLEQKGVCACCQKPETQFHRGNPLPLCVDHCHEGTGVRGLLCRHCNNMLGHAKDDPDTLRRAAVYLESHAAKPKTNIIPLAGRRIGQS